MGDIRMKSVKATPSNQDDQAIIGMPHIVFNSNQRRTQKFESGVVLKISNCLLYTKSFVTFILKHLIVVGFCIVAGVVALPLLMASFLVIRLLLFIFGCGKSYDVATKLNLVILTWLNIDCLFLFSVLAIFYGLAKTIHPLKEYTHDLTILNSSFPLMKLIETYFILCGIFCFSYFVSIFIIRHVMFYIPLKHHTYKSGSLVVPHSVQEIINCLIFWYAEGVVMQRHPWLKHQKILQYYPAHRSIDVVLLVLVLHNLIRLSIYTIVWQLHNLVDHHRGSNKNSVHHQIAKKVLDRKPLVYWADGTKTSIIFMLSMIMLFAVWVSYFGPFIEQHGTKNAQDMFEFGNWTCLSLLILSSLWLVKTCILLLLENRFIYSRLDFETKIVEAAKQLYFLGVIGRRKHDIFELQYLKKQDNHQSSIFGKCINTLIPKQHTVDCSEFLFLRDAISFLVISISPATLIKVNHCYQDPSDPSEVYADDQGSSNSKRREKKLSVKKKKRVRDDLLLTESLTKHTARPTLYELQQMAHYFLAAKKTLLNDKYVTEILQTIPPAPEDRFMETLMDFQIKSGDEQNLTSKESDWSYFKVQFRDGSNLQSWMKEAHKKCVFMANTLASVKELVDSLDKVMSGLLISASFIMWLLLTKLATRKVFAIVASPLLALVFVFGDTCKTYFQGIVFVYMVHSFQVGDLCVIDGNMLEVRTVGVWKTTFTTVDTLVEMTYPNSELMNKNIVNYKTDFDWNYNVELYVSSTMGNIKIMILKQEIEKYLDETYEGGIVELLTIAENNIKIATSFHHNANIDNTMTYHECLKVKRRRQSEFILHVHKLIDQMKSQGSDNQIKKNEEEEGLITRIRV